MAAAQLTWRTTAGARRASTWNGSTASCAGVPYSMVVSGLVGVQRDVHRLPPGQTVRGATALPVTMTADGPSRFMCDEPGPCGYAPPSVPSLLAELPPPADDHAAASSTEPGGGRGFRRQPHGVGCGFASGAWVFRRCPGHDAIGWHVHDRRASDRYRRSYRDPTRSRSRSTTRRPLRRPTSTRFESPTTGSPIPPLDGGSGRRPTTSRARAPPGPGRGASPPRPPPGWARSGHLPPGRTPTS